MRRLALVVIGLLLACSWSTLHAGAPVARDTQNTGPRVSLVAFEGSPVALTSARVISTQDPAVVAFTTRNTSDRVVTDYTARVFVYRSNGRALGFRSVRVSPTPTMQPGTVWAEAMSLPSMGDLSAAQAALVIVTVTAVDSGDVAWRAPSNYLNRVKDEAAQVTGPALK